jgi:hypothetical protein
MIAARALVLLSLVAVACAPVRRAPGPDPETSGFLDDYANLRPVEDGANAHVYRNPDARWTTYHQVLLEPVALWRSGRRSLDPVPQADLARVILDFEVAVQRQLGAGYRLVQKPGPGVMQIRLGITSARATDPVTDVLTAHGTGHDVTPTSGKGPLHPEMRHFLEGAAIEGEIRDSETQVLLAQGVERRRREGAMPLETWDDVYRLFDAWAARLCARLEARTDPH